MVSKTVDEDDLELDGTDVDVYRNSHEKTFSIRSRESGDEYGTVIGHSDFVLLTDVEFVIQEAGQERARETGVKNPHALVRGTVSGTGYDGQTSWNLMARLYGNDMCNVTYDPFETDTFEVIERVRMDTHDYEVGDEIEEALYAAVTEKGVGVILPETGDQ